MIHEIRDLIKTFRAKHKTQLRDMPTLSEKVQDACNKVERSWSGSFAGWHGRMYYRNFQPPSIHERFSGEWGAINGMPEGWEEKQAEEVAAHVETLIGGGFSMPKFEADIKSFRKEAEQLRATIVVELSVLESDNPFAKDVRQIEDFTLGRTKGEFIHERLPGRMMSRDTEALSQGICVASWLYYEGVALEGKSLCESVEQLLDSSDRLVNQIEKREKTSTTIATPAKFNDLHPEIQRKCTDLYKKGAYAEAVERGFKVVRDRLRTLTGYETGSDAFGKGHLYIKGAIAPNVDEDFNKGVQFLTMAIDRFRNEKSHTSDAKIDDPVRAYEYLRLSSLAMHLLENVEIRS